MSNRIPFFLKYIFLVSLLVLVACSKTAEPTNIEPSISIGAATGITRTEATIEAGIITRGTGKLTFLHFRYGESESMDSVSIGLPTDSVKVRFRVRNLKPGTTYHYCAEGGSATATLRSPMLSFSTMPNVRPSVSEATMLSSGPTGLIVGFKIPDDGGSAVTEAGCEVKNASTGEISCLLLPSDALCEGEHRMYVGVSYQKSEYVITPFACNALGKSTGIPLSFAPRQAVVLSNPGDLPILFGEDGMPLDSIVIAGKMNGDDFRFLRRLLKAPLLPSESELSSSVSAVDISDVSIVEGGTTYDGSRFTTEATISTGLFSDCGQLRRITLPMSATSLMRDAFRGCGKLRALTIPANITVLHPSAGCTSLERIEVSAGNVNFKSVDGVLLDAGLSTILWFPQAKTGGYTVPVSVETIGEDAFRGTRITSLFLPSGLKSIGRGAISFSLLSEVSLPDNVSNIPEALFQGSERLTKVRLGKGAAYIGEYAFDGCRLRQMYLAAVIPPYVAENAFGKSAVDIHDRCILHVPIGTADIYKRHSKWGKFKNITED